MIDDVVNDDKREPTQGQMNVINAKLNVMRTTKNKQEYERAKEDTCLQIGTYSNDGINMERYKESYARIVELKEKKLE